MLFLYLPYNKTVMALGENMSAHALVAGGKPLSGYVHSSNSIVIFMEHGLSKRPS
jgi:hypothetical protein